MSPFAQTLISTIVGAICGGSGVTFLTFLIQRHDKKHDQREQAYKELSDKIELISDALRGQGHDRITYLGGRYIQRGGITQDEYDNLYTYLYKPYAALGGNGTAKKVMTDCEKLPIISPDEAERRDRENAK